MNRNISISIILIILFMATVLTLFVNKLTTPRELSRSELLVNGYYSLSQPKEISNFEFVSSNNTKITKDFLKDKWTLVYFGFTNCPDECPVSMSMIRELFLTLSEKGMDLGDKQVLLISVDPENDTPKEIDMYAKGFNKNFYGATKIAGEAMCTAYNDRYGLEIIQTIEKQVLLQTIDKSWREHLLKLEHLRSVIGFRGYAQRDPLNEYKSEAYELFEVLLQTINEDVTKFMAFFQLVDSSKIQNENSNAENAEFSYNKQNEYNEKKPQNTVTANWGKVGRNSPCPCGSGKKYKQCCGKLS